MQPRTFYFLFATSWHLPLVLRHVRACSPRPVGGRPVITSIQNSSQPCCGRSRITYHVDVLISARDNLIASVGQWSCGRSPSNVSATQEKRQWHAPRRLRQHDVDAVERW